MRKTGLAVVFLCVTPLLADTVYWYNGDRDLDTQILNEVGGTNGTALIYDDFVVGPGGVTITGVFSNDAVFSPSFLNAPGIVTQADWQILTGVSAGNGGTVVASGSGAAATQTDTGLNLSPPIPGGYVSGEIYDIEVDGLDVSLAPGTYWLAVAPDLPSGYTSAIPTTAGANGVGTPQAQDGDSFFSVTAASIDFAPAVNHTGADPNDGTGNVDFSMGVISSTPEPGTAALGAGAVLLLCLAAATRRLRFR